jgi:7,8-dihydro-6-hydroxymethylpterin dimethyltransferase
MPFDLTRWKRFTVADTAVWLCPDRPSWFVPTKAGDKLLCNLESNQGGSDFAAKSFLQRLPDPPQSRYLGRGALLGEKPILRELWLHITDRCNLACTHCLFSSGPASGQELELERLMQHINEAAEQGCKLFALTGGEPLVHHGFPELVDHILSVEGSRIAILTNGLLVSAQLKPEWPRDRISLQISLDGKPEQHDRLRGKGRFEQLQQQLGWLRDNGWSFTLSCCATRDNAEDLPWMVDYAADQGASALHLMWHFIRGRGNSDQQPEPLELFSWLISAMERAEARGVTIDNIESLKGQIFSPPGTIYDGSAAGCESAAIGPDDRLYPTAATIGLAGLGTSLESGLTDAWLNSPVLASIRSTTVAGLDDPWRFLLGGGDLDHSYHHSGTFMGNDPYQPLMEQLALFIVSKAAKRLPESESASLCLKMGELLVSCASHGPVALCHSNCLLSLSGSLDSRGKVGEYYASAAGDKRSEILNPVHYDENLIEHVPAAYRFRGYGCGSPVMDAGLKPGERVVDLGCGSGVECFIAARLVGKNGLVTGVDMLEPMLLLARQAAEDVRRSLGFDNLQFISGFLEELPLADECADVMVSNCVLNLSADKRMTFREIFRVLAPGGRLVTADVVCETEPDAAILNDETLRGECISGAMTQSDLLGILEESGFSGFKVLKRLPYRVVSGHPFYSLTFEAIKPGHERPAMLKVFYPGPASGLQTAGGQWLRPGQTALVSKTDAEQLGEQVWQIDRDGFVINVAIASGANCCIAPEAQLAPAAAPQVRHDSGCLVCGAPLSYFPTEHTIGCYYCGKSLQANSSCEQGHFVCDHCHTGDAIELIEHLCKSSTERNPVNLFHEFRRHPSFPLHGPQYHALVPGLLLTCLRNSGHPVTVEQVTAAIRRGGEVSGGSCGYMGVCGAAVGVGIAFSVLLEATPLKGAARQSVQQVVQQVLAEIAGYTAARCCQRDCWLALRAGMRIAGETFGIALPGIEPYQCNQMAHNKECMGCDCPLWAA